jgi:hypothetical protein
MIICCVLIENILLCNFDFIIVINSDESIHLNFNCRDDDDNEGINVSNEICNEYDNFHPIMLNISIVIVVLLLLFKNHHSYQNYYILFYYHYYYYYYYDVYFY